VERTSTIDKLLLLFTVFLAAYQVVNGLEGMETFTVVCYTIAFGVLLVALLLLLILGFDILDSPLVVIVSTVIPLSLSLGLVSQFLFEIRAAYLVFTLIGFFAVVLTRYFGSPRISVVVLSVVHGVAGLIIFILPIVLTLQRETPAGFLLVSLGGGLIGIGGLLLAFLKSGRPILPRETILKVLPGLLLLMTGAFVAGFALL
jgi:hypothetical protein